MHFATKYLMSLLRHVFPLVKMYVDLKNGSLPVMATAV